MNGIVFASPTARRVRPAFTLVELLVVIVIIGILIALLIPAVTAAMTTARNGVMAVELGGLATALEAYKTEYGSYPPDFASNNNAEDSLAIANHLGRNYRYRNKLADSPKKDGQFINLDPSEALVFWLRGFSPSPRLPLSGPGTRIPVFDFDETRLTDNDGGKVGRVGKVVFLIDFQRLCQHAHLDRHHRDKHSADRGIRERGVCRVGWPLVHHAHESPCR